MSKSNPCDQCAAGPSAASTSSTKTLLGEDALKFLFDYRPKFTKLEGFEGGDVTRYPAQYDMHMHSQLVLKDIILFPDMPEQLAGVIDSRLYPLTAGRLPRVPPSSQLHPSLVSDINTGILIGHKDDLKRVYPSLQKISSLIASTLFAGLDQWSDIFRYSDTPTSVMPCALADGYLSLDKDAIGLAENLDAIKLPKGLDSDIQLVIEMGLSDFLFWDFKNMNEGSEGVMQAISHLAGLKFPWVRCPTSQSCYGRFCQKKTSDGVQFAVTGYKTGVDGDILGDVESGVANTSELRFDMSNSLSVASDLNTSGWEFKRAVRKSGKGTKKRSASGDGSDEDDNGDDRGADEDSLYRLPFSRQDFAKALRIIQQIWAEAVSIDATFMVLNAGSREFIGIRDRKLQRLYLSPLIDLDDPRSLPAGYLKIHAGLRIAALHDVIQRAKRLKALPELYTFKYDHGEPYQDKVPLKIARPCKSTKTARAEKVKISEAHADENAEGSGLASELFQPLRKAGNVTDDEYGLGMSESSGFCSRGNGSSLERWSKSTSGSPNEADWACGLDKMDVDV